MTAITPLAWTGPLPRPENIEIHDSGHDDRVSLAWTIGDARFHIWVKRDPGLPFLGADGGTLYKNPPRGVTRGDPGYFQTRYLNPAAQVNAPAVEYARAYAIANDLLARGAEEWAAAVKHSALKSQAERFKHLSEEAAELGYKLVKIEGE